MLNLAEIGAIVHARRNALGISQVRLAHLSGLSRQTISGLESGALQDLGFNRVTQVLNVLGLDSAAPSPRPRGGKNGLWMAAKTASVSYKHELDADTLAHTLVQGEVPRLYVAHIAHLLDEAPIPMLVMAVEDAAQHGHVAPRRIWRNIARLAKDLGLSRQHLLT
jgi:transcriptional regulator with XRE-family HTH domain